MKGDGRARTAFLRLPITLPQWRDPTGLLQKWESAERTTRRGPVDGVAIVAHVTSGGGPRRIILAAQFRPPLGNTVIEVEFETMHGLRHFCARPWCRLRQEHASSVLLLQLSVSFRNRETSAPGGAGAREETGFGGGAAGRSRCS